MLATFSLNLSNCINLTTLRRYKCCETQFSTYLITLTPKYLLDR